MALVRKEEVFHIIVPREEAELIVKAIKEFTAIGEGEQQAKNNILNVLHQVLVVDPKRN